MYNSSLGNIYKIKSFDRFKFWWLTLNCSKEYHQTKHDLSGVQNINQYW
jgi:hypothetical protein